MAVADLAQQLQHLRLDGDVERGGRLVGDQQLGLERQAHGDHRALLHAARELVRILARPLLGLAQMYAPQQVDRLGLRRLPTASARCRTKGSPTCWSMRSTGLSARSASCGMKAMRSPRSDRRSASDRREERLARRAGCRPQPWRMPRGMRPSTTSAVIVLPLPDSPISADDLARPDLEADPLDDARRAAPPGDTRRDSASICERRRHVGQRMRRACGRPLSPCRCGSKTVAQPVAEQVEAEHAQEHRHARHDAEPRRLRHEAAAGVQHVAPGGLRRLRAEAEEAQRRFEQHGIGEGDGRLDQQRRRRRWAGSRARGCAHRSCRSVRAASTYCWRSTSCVAARARREKPGMKMMPIAIMALRMLVPRLAIRMTASRIAGNENSSSISRISTHVDQGRRNRRR